MLVPDWETRAGAAWWKESRNSSGPSFVIPHFAGMFAPRQECKTRYWAGLSESQISDSNWDWAKTPRESSLMRNTVSNKLPSFLWVCQRQRTIIKPSISVHISELQAVNKMLSFTWPSVLSNSISFQCWPWWVWGSSGKYRPPCTYFRLCSLLCSIYSLGHSCLCLRNGKDL